ncbi:phosphoribosylanthranilate isomerase [Cytobacillus solani]|uniref:N-(5'-phosphoribosyl)anthranilate isomerase n=1 Tax=Cytobacillus solani TaxID=1637975 RepID=A0A0Q3VI16_9BACI|nr:phosphoribosylanthranilate isomerase [Cytobacillus solani]KOP82971.1 N-(5'-phosphoribosyl)anthranilate isomerase [Bacillus sp. FJAT-21945]KQL19995.1 N-(5'-phosphoribosyl)anthranilate isomerase [Cytobacillus solani]USK53239.1 phosphoribosylanthranilate isomerase [Cytobacillus solani]
MKIKICGITDLDTAIAAVEYGADALGFVFAESKRRITIDRAKEIIKVLPKNFLKIGVFVNEQKETIERILEETEINAIQLHGDESPDDCAGFLTPVIKAISIGSAKDILKADEYECEYLLLDSPKGKYRGGNGTSFDWGVAAGQKVKRKKVILAGGLTPGNVIEAIQIVQPYMVDVSSGVELDGKKDKEKIKRFIDEVKGRKRNGNIQIAR